MNAPRPLAALLTSSGRYALDVPVAALAGLSVAFLAFAMPGDTLAELIGSTGLASLIPAAEPPLGLKARIGIGAAGAVAVFAAAYLLLRWLDRIGTRSAEDDEPVEEAPRLRRRDFHPDAPPRPPIMATHEFGEPEYAPAAEAPPEPESEPERREPEPEPEPERREPQPEPERRQAEPPEAQDEWLLDVPALPAKAEPEFLSPPAPEPVSRSASPAPSPVEAPAASRNLDELMARLEQGLARRLPTGAEPERPAEPVARAEPTPFPEAADDRLQSAIDSLQRLAARGD